jgi:hypothetical protein
MCFALLTFYPVENVLTDLNCYSWFKIPHCILFDKLSQLRKEEEKNPLLKLGIQTYMREKLLCREMTYSPKTIQLICVASMVST